MKIEVEGKDYKVIESLGFQGGYRAMIVDTPNGERTAVKRAGEWTWWMVQDRLK